MHHWQKHEKLNLAVSQKCYQLDVFSNVFEWLKGSCFLETCMHICVCTDIYRLAPKTCLHICFVTTRVISRISFKCNHTAHTSSRRASLCIQKNIIFYLTWVGGWWAYVVCTLMVDLGVLHWGMHMGCILHVHMMVQLAVNDKWCVCILGCGTRYLYIHICGHI